jgi:hypothetical protein
MEEARQVEVNDASNVIALFDPARTPAPKEPGPTAEELADFRKYWPLMKEMLTEFKTLKARGGCPIMQEVLGP